MNTNKVSRYKKVKNLHSLGFSDQPVIDVTASNVVIPPPLEIEIKFLLKGNESFFAEIKENIHKHEQSKFKIEAWGQAYEFSAEIISWEITPAFDGCTNVAITLSVCGFITPNRGKTSQAIRFFRK